MNVTHKHDKEIDIWYLYHSGFAIKTLHHFLVFDYYPGNTKTFWGDLKDGLLNPIDLKEENLFVFSSHSHYDHFNKNILELKDHVDHIHYILSDDIAISNQFDKLNILKVHPYQSYQCEDLSITTLRSTDAGVAFLIKVDGITIYYAGDLNWWHWNGEEQRINKTMGEDYKHEIDSLIDKHIDIAFVPLDPRLEEHYILGVDYVMNTLHPDHLFPMHFADQYEVFTWLEEEPRAKDYLNKIYPISHRGEHFNLKLF